MTEAVVMTRTTTVTVATVTGTMMWQECTEAGSPASPCNSSQLRRYVATSSSLRRRRRYVVVATSSSLSLRRRRYVVVAYNVLTYSKKLVNSMKKTRLLKRRHPAFLPRWHQWDDDAKYERQLDKGGPYPVDAGW